MRLRSFFSILLLAMALPAVAARADEVILHNGDRVTGVVTGIADGKITIAETKFGTITAKLSDVKSFTSTRFSGPATTQPATSQPTSQPAVSAAKPQAAPALPPAPVKAPPVKRWSGAVTATALATRGNSDSESVRVSIDALRKGDNNTLTLAAGYAFGQTENPTTGEKTTNIDNWFAAAKLDYAFGPKWYNYALVRFEEDSVANLALRVSPGAGVGYRWINKPDVHLNSEIGATWVYESYDNDGSTEHMAVRSAYHFDKKLNDKVSLVHNVEFLPNVQDPRDFNLNADVGIRALLTAAMFAEFKAEWRHDASPAPGAEYNDLRYTIGVGWKF